MAAPPPLDIICNILVRLPPGEPASLLRASAVCRSWRRLVSEPFFRRLYRKFHGTPALLGLFRNPGNELDSLRFVRTTAWYPSTGAIVLHPERSVFDSSHGRLLLIDFDCNDTFVWDPVTGELHSIPHPPLAFVGDEVSVNFTVLCGGAGCDHCHGDGGCFRVAFVCCDGTTGCTNASLYSSDTGAWTEPTSTTLQWSDAAVFWLPGTLVGDAVYYFVCKQGVGIPRYGILRYNLVGVQGLSVIDLPDSCVNGMVLFSGEGGGLGLAGMDGWIISHWSMDTATDGGARWVQEATINLDTLITGGEDYSYADIVASGAGAILVSTNAGFFAVDLKALVAKKVCQWPAECEKRFYPFFSFFATS